jgi:hypothetical protein
MGINVLPLDGLTYNGQATRQAFSALMGVAPSGRSLGAVSGVRPGTPSNTVNLSPAFTWNVGAHSGIIDAETSPFAAPYLYATTGGDTGTVTAADATNPRVDIIYVQVNDQVQDGSGLESGQVVYQAGTPASTPQVPTPNVTPTSRALVLAQISVPKAGGGNPTVTWVAPTWGQAPWSTYTVSTTNFNVVNGTLIGRWQQNGKTVHFSIFYQVGSSDTFSSGVALFFSVPVNPEASNGIAYTPLGTWVGDDTSASTEYVGTVSSSALSSIRLHYGGNTSVTSTNPTTWAAGDVIRIAGSYESS